MDYCLKSPRIILPVLLLLSLANCASVGGSEWQNANYSPANIAGGVSPMGPSGTIN